MTSPLPSSKPQPYVRPMGRCWWRRDPFFVRYMWREATALCVLAYAIVWTVGLIRLSQGEAAWNGWLHSMASPLGILLHVVLLAGMALHAYTWFEVMPKTMPGVYDRHGKRVPDAVIMRLGLAAFAVASIVLFVILWMVRS